MAVKRVGGGELLRERIFEGPIHMNSQRVFTELDRSRLGNMLDSPTTRAMAAWRVLDDLEWRLEQASSVPPEEISNDVVTMNSTVRLIEVGTDREQTRTIVYPEDVDLVDVGVSVLGPMGGALIGREVGDLVECDEGDDAGRWRIAEIVFQPEQAGEFRL